MSINVYFVHFIHVYSYVYLVLFILFLTQAGDKVIKKFKQYHTFSGIYMYLCAPMSE